MSPTSPSYAALYDRLKRVGADGIEPPTTGV